MTHGAIYLAKCKDLGIPPNPAALQAAGTEQALPLGEKQTDLHGFVKSTPKWTKEGLLEHILEFIILDDQVPIFQFIEYLTNYFSSPSQWWRRSHLLLSLSTNAQQQLILIFRDVLNYVRKSLKRLKLRLYVSRSISRYDLFV